ncbi:Ppx/GppA family phosphatase [Sphingomonas sp. PL-96]|uniref:Ppx/GppA phosphatase family protein n=1 Tax=Sphingomonas sp. PL-96 TaxID=2887201 RepID=UPI001E5D93AC|nr:Ppx/GppA phosphatase family protein [Sphingomonas sp. PL-96]MCC2977006.1 Ppx/GppA family phosphatase [Sphingomonas sp. PL-96]
MGDTTARLPHRRGAAPVRSAPHASAQPRFPRARHFAALDLGTNNCRLLIARPQGQGFAVVDAFSRIVRLGEGLAATGRLSEAAIERTIAALKICADKLRRRNVTLSRAVATEACRRASNGADFIRRVHEETGIFLDVISAEEEARLAVLGCHALLEPGEGPALVFDIGGGSTELVLLDTTGTVPSVVDWHSTPWGVVSLTESLGAGRDAPIASGAFDAMRQCVVDSFAPFARRLPQVDGQRRLLGTSGTVTTLASVHLGLDSYDRSAIDGLIVPSDAMRQVSRRLAGLELSGRAKVACIGPERADLVVAGCAILEAILDLWPAERLGIADRGIREGILRRLMQGRYA